MTEADIYRIYNELLDTYNITIRTTSGCGERGQTYIDDAYNKAKAFWDEHEEALTEIGASKPIKTEMCRDDGYGGAFTGIATVLLESGKRDPQDMPDCLIQ